MGETPTTFTATLKLGDTGTVGHGYAKETILTFPSPADPTTILETLNEHINVEDTKTALRLELDPTITEKDALILYVVLFGYTGRFLPVTIGTQGIHRKTIGKLTSPTRPETPILEHTITPNSTDTEIRYAKEATLEPQGTPVDTLTLFIKTALLRKIGPYTRFPRYQDTNLQALLGDVIKAKRKTRKKLNTTLAEVEDLPARLQRMVEATQAPISAIMQLLGSTSNAEGDRWHCPRPWRHTNGDQNPSMKLNDNQTRCYRCDREWVDPVRLVMDVKNWSGDEATDWILKNTQN